MSTRDKVFLIIFFQLVVSFSFAATFTVTTIADNNNNTTPTINSLRWAIVSVNAAAAAGPHIINFNITPLAAPYTIPIGGTFPAITNVVGGVTIDGYSQPPTTQTSPIIFVNGPGYGECFNFVNCPNSLVQGMGMYNFGGNGSISINTGSNNVTVRGCWIGLNTAGTATAGGNNGPGIWINGCNNCTIGSDIIANPQYKNVIGNRQFGIQISNGAQLNVLKGNYVGTNAAGTAAIAISASALYITDASKNIIGGTTAGERNLFCGATQYGVFLEAINNASRFNVLYNNYIGVGSNGSTAIPNSSNTVEFKANAGKPVSNNSIGGTLAGQGNIISASSGGCGITMEGGPCDSNLFAGNYIGLAANGTTLLVNGSSNNHHGIYGNGTGSDHNSIKNNVIVSPGRGSGIKFDVGGFDTVSYNYMGVDATGLTLVGMGTGTNDHGLCYNNNSISNQVIIGNVVAGAKGCGMKMDGDCSNYLIQGNIVGMNKNGLGTTFGNDGTGIYFSNGTAKSNILIGGTLPVHRNIVSKNGINVLSTCSGTFGYGIILEKTVGAVISGNYIGTDATGNVGAGNGGSGIMLNGGCNNITVGGLTVGERNVICSNGNNCSGPPANVRHGVQFNQNTTATSMLVYGNYVGIGADGTTLLGNAQEGVSSYQTPNITVGGNSAAYRNVIAGNIKGVYFQPASATGCKVLGNYIGTDATGTLARPNTIGVHVQDAPGTIIGGPNPGEGNVISGNSAQGILLEDADNTIIQQNLIGTTVDGITKLANIGDGIRIKQDGANGTTGVLVGSPTNTALGNVIAFNANGVMVFDAGSQKNSIRRNSIFCNGSASVNGINLNGAGNINIPSPGPLVVPTYITAPTPGIQVANTPSGNIVSTDVVEVFYDNACGTCQGRTYLGNATNSGTQWSYSPLPAAADCSPKGTVACPSGVQNITATRTDNLGNTSQFMSCAPIALPVELLSFTAKRYSSNSALIDWSTASEKNNAYFELLRSTDGNTFTTIAKIAGAGNATNINYYTYSDESLAPGLYYYMLIQVDFDGKQTLSRIVSIQIGSAGTIEVVPTAVSGGESIKILNFTGVELVEVSLVDMTGKILSDKKSVSDVESYISTSGIASGMYMVKISTSADLVIKKVLVY